jgi:hypothetical protein
MNDFKFLRGYKDSARIDIVLTLSNGDRIEMNSFGNAFDWLRDWTRLIMESRTQIIDG